MSEGDVTFGERYGDRRDYANRSLLVVERALRTGPERSARFIRESFERGDQRLLKRRDSAEGVKMRPREMGVR